MNIVNNIHVEQKVECLGFFCLFFFLLSACHSAFSTQTELSWPEQLYAYAEMGP